MRKRTGVAAALGAVLIAAVTVVAAASVAQAAGDGGETPVSTQTHKME
ncbi:hypothetical protein SAMN05444920_104301 [Nonomuraea solani]|uniref:Uncharacterized protein n=1 Tax=Nonomuraea solani TaxID=1144553 RepID=A0A1H6CRM1_9ACTN|nr:hypothetical protein [Nonomuraea solani]SEG75528.1 hypothetical protein SAMN05444920_104301 [Nonomuraea solani]